MDKKSILNKIFALLCAFILSVSLAALSGLAALGATGFSQGYVKRVLQSQNYYTQVADGLLIRCTEYFNQAGIGQLMLREVITPDGVQRGINSQLDAVYNGVLMTYDASGMFAPVEEEVRAGFEANGVDVTDELLEGLQNVIYECELSYSENMALPMAGALVTLVANYAKNRLLLYGVLAVFAAWGAFALWRLAKREQRAGYIGGALLGAGLTLLVPGLVLRLTGAGRNVVPVDLVSEPVVYAFLQGIFLALAVAGAVLLALGVLAAVVLSLLAKRGGQTDAKTAMKQKILHPAGQGTPAEKPGAPADEGDM